MTQAPPDADFATHLPVELLLDGRYLTAAGALITAREAQLTELLWAGLSSSEAALRLGVSASTVRSAASKLCARLGLNRSRLLIFWDRAVMVKAVDREAPRRGAPRSTQREQADGERNVARFGIDAGEREAAG